MKGWACYFPIWHKYSIFGNMAIGVCTFIRIRHVQLTKLNFTTETVRPKLVEGSVSVMVRQAHHEREP